MRVQRMRNGPGQSSAGMWRSPCRRFFAVRDRIGWRIAARQQSDILFLDEYQLNWRYFPTRREALARLEDALALDESWEARADAYE